MRITIPQVLIALSSLLIAACTKKSDITAGTGNSSPTPSNVTVETFAGKNDLVSGTITGPGSMCMDQNGYLYFTEQNFSVVLKIDPLLHTLGNFVGAYDVAGCEDDPFGSGNPSLTSPENLWIGSDQQVYIGDYGCGKIKVTSTTGESAALQYNNPNYLYPTCNAACKDSKGNIYILDTYDGLFEVRAQDQTLTFITGSGQLGIASSLATDATGDVMYIAASHQIWQFSGGSFTSIAGGELGSADGQGKSASFGGAMALCVGTDGNIYVADINNNLIRKVTPNGVVTTIVGKTDEGYVDGSGDMAKFYGPDGIAFTTSGDNNILYVSDYYNNVIRKVTFPSK